MTLLPRKDLEEYRGILADVEDSPYFKAAPGSSPKRPEETLESATERKWILEALIRDEIRDYENVTGLKVDFITLKRDDADSIEKVDAKVCL